MLIEKEYAVKDDEIKQYLPINEVTEEMLGIYEKIFSLKCVEVKNPVVWHPDVRQLEIYDRKSNDYMGTVTIRYYLLYDNYYKCSYDFFLFLSNIKILLLFYVI